MTRRKLVGLVLLVASIGTHALSWAQAATAAPKPAMAVVDDSSKALPNLIESSREYATEDKERFYSEVEALLAPVVDFRVFARGVMATHYKRATPEQRTRFAESFKWSLVRTYALALTEFRDGEVRVLEPEKPSSNPKRDRVKMEIRTTAGDVYPIVYAMRLGKDETWRIYNLVVNGVNMGLTFRSQFSSAMKDRKYGGDLDKVIDAWSNELGAIEDSETSATDAAAAAAG